MAGDTIVGSVPAGVTMGMAGGVDIALGIGVDVGSDGAWVGATACSPRIAGSAALDFAVGKARTSQ